eukprot:gene17113-20384_t
MNKLFIVAIILCFTAPIYADIWTNCGGDSDHFQIGNVVITPDPPTKGESINITASGTLNEQVTAGNVHVLLKYGFITLINQNINLCESESPFPCPIASGAYEKSVVLTIPDSAPSGTYKGHISITDQNDQEIACIDLDLIGENLGQEPRSNSGKSNRMHQKKWISKSVLSRGVKEK